MNRTWLGVATTALLLGWLTAANAVPTLRYTLVETGQTFTCSDGDGSCDLNPLPDYVTFQALFEGGVAMSLNTGATMPFSDGNPLTDIASFDLIASGARTLLVEYSDQDFDLQGRLSLEIGGVLSGSGEVTAKAYLDASNTLFGTSTLIGELGAFGSGPLAGAVSPELTTPTGAPYSITQLLTLRTPEGGGHVLYTGNFEVNVPEPTTLALMALGLLAIGTWRRRFS